MRGGQRHALFSLLAICTSVHAADIQRTPDIFTLSIDRQPLDGALQQLADQCGVQMIFFSRVTEGLSAPAIRGDYTLAAAMQRLLTGSGLTFEVINPQTVEVRPLQAKPSDRSRSREAVAARQTQKSSDDASGPMEEVIVVGLAEQLVATRIATALREIPQTISIVTAEQMRERNDVVLADVLEHAPGITMKRSTSLDQDFYSRAYHIESFHIDGGAAVNPKLESNLLFLGTPDLIEVDHIEILRGADGLFSGNANPGGTISLVRKRPQRTFALELSAATGSWDDRRVALDITGPLAVDGALRGRAAAVYSQEGYFYDIDPHEKTKIFGALEYDFTDAATLTAGVSYQWDEAAGVGGGLPFYADGRDSRLPRDTALEFDWTRYRSELGGIYLQYRQQFAEWEVKVNASGWRTEAEFAYANFNHRLIDPVTNELNAQASATFSASPNVHTQNTADVTVTGTLDWFGWREELALGADFMRLKVQSDNIAYSGFGERLGDVRTFDPADYPDPRLTGPPTFGIANASTQDQYGIFAALRVYFDNAWSIVGGARLSGDSTDTQLDLYGGSFRSVVLASYGTDQVVTPYAGLMYAFNRHYSLYASYADIYRAQITLLERSPGNLLEPVQGVNVEAGIKGEWRNGALNGSLALYRIEQSNFPKAISSSQPANPDLRVPRCCFTGVSNKSRGVDVELSGELTRQWSIGAGYAYNENESPTGDALSTDTPKHLLKAWTNVRMPGALDRWQVGGGLHAQSETTSRSEYCSRSPTRVCGPVDGVQPAYVVLDLRAAFDVDRNWQVALTVNNVLDETYYESFDTPALQAWYGAPRNWTLRIDGRY